MDFSKILEELKKDYEKLLDSFSVIDKKDPMTPVKIKELQHTMNHWYQSLEDHFLMHPHFQYLFSIQNDTATTDFNKNIVRLKNHLSDRVKNIAKTQQEACASLKEHIEFSKCETEEMKQRLDQDIHYFLMTSEQNKMLLSEDFEESKKRFDYQKNAAKESYLEIVKKNNLLLADIKTSLDSEYKDALIGFDADNENIIQKLEKMIETKTIELNSLLKVLENERNDMKEKFRQESTLLNNNIKKIAEEKNRVIDKARSQYSKAQSDASIERENKRQTYQAKSQQLLKEFVTKIAEIDETTSTLNKEYEINADKIKRQYYATVFEKTKIFHAQLEKIYKSSITFKGEYDKYTTHLIRIKNKQHLRDIQIYKKEIELKLLTLTKNYTKLLADNKNTKNYLEIDKNFAIKNITDQEQYDNKYYQEKNSIFENDYNYIVKTANYRFAQKANLLRCQSQIRTKLLERNFDGIEANYYKRIETIQSKINSYKLEINLTKQLHRSIHKYQENKYQNTLHLEEVSNLLEIEKNKLLKEFNESQYLYNIKSIELTKAYGFKKIDLENDKEQKLIQLKKELQTLLLEKNTASSSFTIKKENLNKKYMTFRTKLTNNNELKMAKAKFFQTLFDADFAYLKDLTENYLFYLKSIHDTHFQVIDVLLKDVIPTADNFNYLESLLNSFFQIFINFFNKILAMLEFEFNTILEERLSFIEAFKYQSSYEHLKSNYLSQQTTIKEKKNELLNQMDNSTKTIENFRQKIYTIINDNEMIRNTAQGKSKKLDSKSALTIKENLLKIREYKEKIEGYTKMILMNNEDLSDCNKQLHSSTLTYQSELQKLKKMQGMDSKIYSYFKEVLPLFCHHFTMKSNYLFDKSVIYVSNEKHFLHYLAKNKKNCTRLMEETSIVLKRMINYFVEKNRLEAQNTQLKLSREFKQELEAYQKQYDKAFALHQKEYKETITEHEKKVDAQKFLIDKTMAFHDQCLLQAKLDFEEDTTSLNEMYEKTTNSFFDYYYAMRDNIKNITLFHKNKATENEETFKSEKMTSINENVREKDDLNEKLQQFIKTKNSEIEHLPIAFKYNSQLLNNETKKQNNELHLNIREAKVHFNTERRALEKKIATLKSQLNQDIMLNDIDQQNNLKDEKKEDKSHLRQSLRNIRIYL